MFRNGWNIRGYLTFGALYDIGKKNSQDFESYPGQRAMLYGSAWLSFLYDLGRLGMNDGSVFTLDFHSGAASWNDYMPSESYISELSVFTPFANDWAELKFGMVRAEREFYGSVTGTSIGASALRAESAITIQAGLSALEPSPYLGLTVHDKDRRFYVKGAVAQSMSPQGLREWQIPGWSVRQGAGRKGAVYRRNRLSRTRRSGRAVKLVSRGRYLQHIAVSDL